jgi:fructosamine-3-kinase
VGGGCINNASRLQTASAVYLLKWNPAPLPGMFSAEAKGLRLLAETGPVRVPAVMAVREAGDDCPAFILLEWLEGSGGSQAELGEQLAELHRRGTSPHQPPAYGLDEANYLGSSVQPNTWEPDWARFFATYRLRPQLETARRINRLPPPRARRLEDLIERLPALLGGIERRPALIHGDLWGGNVIPAQDGLALIDPAVSYSDREAEIAYTELFGGFSRQFYAGYQAVWPLDTGYAQRRDLYNLYHLLNHLNLFGESYGGQVDAVLSFYS